MAWIDLPDVRGVEALDRRKDVLEAGRTMSANPLLSERGLPQHVTESRQTLLENLGPVRHEEQASPGQFVSQTSIVNCSR